MTNATLELFLEIECTPGKRSLFEAVLADPAFTYRFFWGNLVDVTISRADNSVTLASIDPDDAILTFSIPEFRKLLCRCSAD